MKMHLTVLFSIIAIFVIQSNAAIIGVDFGTDLLKISLVKPGYPFETVTDFNSRRLTPSSVAFYDGDRLFGDDALNVGGKRPNLAFSYIKSLIGLNDTIPEDHMIKLLRFPYTLVHNDRGTISFKLTEAIHDFDEFSIEELLGMLMGYVKAISEHFGKDKIRDCVITVPSAYTHYQRRAIIDAAELVNLNVLSLIDENTAAALQYGLDRKFENQTHIALIYNTGSVGTEVTIAKYQTVMKSKKEPQRNFEIIGKDYDTNLGGWIVDANLLKYFEKEYYKTYGTSTNITTNMRANARMRATATKTKKVLNANKALPVSIESIDGDRDLRIKEMKRIVISNIVDEYKDRFVKPIENALKMANITKDDLDVFEVIGGCTRILRVQEVLKDYLKTKDISFHLNGDESMAFGSAFRGANMSKSFKVRYVRMTDISIYQAHVKLFEDPLMFVPTESQQQPWSKVATLFPIGSAYGSKKVVSFTRDKSFHVNLYYNRTSTFPDNVDDNIISFNVTGVEEASEKYKDLGKPKIHLTFLLSDSGIYNLTKAEAEWEETKEVPAPKPKPKKKTPKVTPPPMTPVNSTETDNSTETNTTTTEQPETVEKPIEETTNTTEPIEEVIEEPKMINKTFVYTVSLDITEYYLPNQMRPLNAEEKLEFKEKLALLNRKDDEKKALGQAKSELESAIYSIREKLDSTQNIDIVSSEESRNEISSLCTDLEDWLYGDGTAATLMEYKEKHRELDKLANPIFNRAREYVERPKQIKKYFNYVEECKNKLEDWKKTKPQITELERNDTLLLIEDTSASINELIEKQSALTDIDDPYFTSSDIKYKIKSIKEKMNILSRKRPLPKPKVPKNTTANSNDTESSNTTKIDTDDLNSNAQTPVNETEVVEEFTEENVEKEL